MDNIKDCKINESLSTTITKQSRILIVDDEPANIQVLRGILGGQYQLLFAKSGQQAIEVALNHTPDLILMDVVMPEMSGYEAVAELKKMKETADIPVIFITSMSGDAHETQGFDCKAVDYITKPAHPNIVLARVRTHLSLVRIDALNKTREQIIHCLGHAAEYKDNETGLHVIRMSKYSKVIAEAAGLTEEECELICTAAPMHDIGKIGIPDRVLLKPGKLTEQEWLVMKRHPFIGHQIIGNQDSPLLALAASIAYTHHEKWNGTGYPRGLKGREIPLEGRIVALADVFDALTTARPYKPAWSIDKALNLITEEAGEHFDPNLVPLFLDNIEKILEIREEWMETDSYNPAEDENSFQSMEMFLDSEEEIEEPRYGTFEK
ncbi:HD domain-containing phosphohydrolase [Litoribrevibacter albus]|uniref:Two-component system response regulator n=1 Tax=Litoribrevibacter albus TaxID=1473156 RepID=A0AA37SAV6_9GAMM|nr:HD domain-containing phosphohydrolase [Litoribrevibacter albus]GLQ31053.1 two-component system response regulator [Litoribrevibacter albus]